MKGIVRGFTLIELMIVIAIIAILAAILIPNFLHARAESQTAACEGNEKSIATAMEEYAVDHNGTYPTIPTLITPYLDFSFVDPSGGGYTITLPTGTSNFGSYEITDGGAHDPTTTTGLHLSGSNVFCTSCTSVWYYQNGGIVGE